MPVSCSLLHKFELFGFLTSNRILNPTKQLKKGTCSMKLETCYQMKNSFEWNFFTVSSLQIHHESVIWRSSLSCQACGIFPFLHFDFLKTVLCETSSLNVIGCCIRLVMKLWKLNNSFKLSTTKPPCLSGRQNLLNLNWTTETRRKLWSCCLHRFSFFYGRLATGASTICGSREIFEKGHDRSKIISEGTLRLADFQITLTDFVINLTTTMNEISSEI